MGVTAHRCWRTSDQRIFDMREAHGSESDRGSKKTRYVADIAFFAHIVNVFTGEYPA